MSEHDKGIKYRYLGASLIALGSLGLFVGNGIDLVQSSQELGKIDQSVAEHTSAVYEKVQDKLDESEANRTKSVSELLSDGIKTSLPDTSIYVSGSYETGYCIAGFNEKGYSSKDGILYYDKGAIVSDDSFSCSEDATQMTLLSGPGDNKVAGGADYEEPKVNNLAKFIFSSIGAIAGIMGAAFIVPYRPPVEQENVPALPSGSSAGSPPNPKNKSVEATESQHRTESLIKRYAEIRSEWASYELDIAKILEYPAITDMSVPATGNFHKALYRAGLIAPQDTKAMMDINSFKDFEKSVVDLEYKFRLMLNEAKRVKWNSYDAKEQSSLRTAQSLLAVALNSASSSNERQIAYKRLIKELEGIIVLPETTVLELEAKIMPEIDAPQDRKLSLS